ncbi:MAG: CPBP family intramembrane glutamic endopeptidase [Chloroflexota bacterium]
MVTWIIESTLQWLACIGLCLPLIALAGWSEKKRRAMLRPLAALAGFFWVALALARSGSAITLLPSPWQAMIFEAAFALFVLAVTRSAKSGGLGTAISRRAWRDAAIATALLLIYVIARNFGLRWLNLAESGQRPNLEYLLYLATLPGIAEELVYRGVIQSHLNRVFPSRRRLGGAALGWGFAITAVLFWGIHAFSASGWSLSFHWQTLTLPLIAGLVLGWMRERTQSIWPGVIAHNLLNLVWVLF